MALRALMAFDHIPAAVSLTGGNVAAYSTYPLALSTGANSGVITLGAEGTVTDSDGTWLATGSTNSGTTFGAKAWAIPLSLFDQTTIASYFGFRFKLAAFTATTNAFNILSIDDGSTTSASQGAGVSLFSILLKSDFAFVVGQNYFIEVKWDRVNRQFTVWVDNVLVVNQRAYPLALNPNMFLNLGHHGQGTPGGGWTFQYKDMYFVDNTQGAQLPDTRLGVIKALALSAQSADAVGYTVTGGVTPLAALTSPVTSTPATLTTPVLTSPATLGLSPVDVSFAGPTSGVLDPSIPILGVAVVCSTQRGAGTPTQIKYSMKDSAVPANVSAQAVQTFDTDNQVPRFPAAYAAYAPDGSAWTSAKISATTIVMQPGQLGS